MSDRRKRREPHSRTSSRVSPPETALTLPAPVPSGHIIQQHPHRIGSEQVCLSPFQTILWFLLRASVFARLQPVEPSRGLPSRYLGMLSQSVVHPCLGNDRS